MIKRIKNFLKNKYRRTSIKGLVLSIVLISASVFIFLSIIMMVAERFVMKRLDNMVDSQLSVGVLINDIIDSFNRATYSAFMNINRGNFLYARTVFNEDIDKAISYVNEYTSKEGYRKGLKIEELTSDFLDFKIYIQNYKLQFNRLIEYKESLTRNRYMRKLMVNNIDRMITNLRNDISIRITSGNPGKEELLFLKQAILDLLLLNEGIKKLNNDFNDYLDNYSGKKYPKFDLEHEFRKLDFILNSILLNVPEYSSRLKGVLDVFSSFKKSFEEEIVIAQRMFVVEKDTSFTFDVLQSLGGEILREVNEKIRFMKNHFAHFVNTAFFFIVASTGLLVAFSILVFFQIMRDRLFKPLDTLLKAIKITGEGKRDVILQMNNDDELKIIAEYFNEMARSIRDREDALIREKETVERQKRELETIKKYVEDIIHASPNAIVTFDKNLRVVFVNRRAEELIGSNIEMLKGNVLNKDSCELKNYFSEIKKVIESGKEVILNKIQFSPPNSSEKIIANLYIYPLRGIDGGGAVLEIEDVTEMVTLEQKMIESQKMETVGLLAGGFAHDFNNLLTGMIGYIDLARMSDETEKIKFYLNSVKEIADHAAKLVQQILLFSRSTAGKKENINLGVVIESALGMIKAPVKRNIKVVKEIDRDIELFADSTQITQAVLNIILNAFEAVNEKGNGVVKITARRCTDRDKLKNVYNLNNNENYIIISVEDNGVGMSKEVRERMFDPFFTTKVRGAVKGTGLGLSIVYRIVKNHEGIIHVESEEGKGTKIDVLLPVRRSESSTGGEFDKKVQRGTGTIVIVDDEDVVRETGSEILRHLGYEVISFRSGRECIDFFKNGGGKNVDLIILDLLMPEMDGEQTLKVFSELGIKKPVLIASGYITLDMNYLKNYDYVMGIIKKPYSVEDFSTKISQILSIKEKGSVAE